MMRNIMLALICLFGAASVFIWSKNVLGPEKISITVNFGGERTVNELTSHEILIKASKDKEDLGICGTVTVFSRTSPLVTILNVKPTERHIYIDGAYINGWSTTRTAIIEVGAHCTKTGVQVEMEY